MSVQQRDEDDRTKATPLSLRPSSVAAREQLCRSAGFQLQLKGENQSFIEKDDTGFLVSSETFVPATLIPPWNYGRALKHVRSTAIPNDCAILVHLGEQRPFVKWWCPKKSSHLFLCLSKSHLRDRILLHDGMTLVIRDGSGGVAKVLVKLDHTDETLCAFDKHFDANEFLTSIFDYNEYSAAKIGKEKAVAKDQVSSETTLSTSPRTERLKSSLKPTNSATDVRKHVSWGEAEVIMQGEVARIAPVEEDDESVQVKVDIICNDVQQCSLSQEGSYVLLCPSGLRIGESNSVIDLPVKGENFIGAIVLHSNQAFLALPRVFDSTPYEFVVLLDIPDTVDFPLQPGDELAVEDNDRIQIELKLDAARPSRSVPNPGGKESQATKSLIDFAIEVVPRATEIFENRSETVVHSIIQNKQLVRPSAMMTLGRSDACDIIVPDAKVVPHHATLYIRNGGYPTIRAENDSVYLMLGKGDRYFRQPLPLRTGDVFSLGRSDIKVVYQQRGSRQIQLPINEQFLLRMPSKTHIGCQLRRRETKGVKLTASEKASEPIAFRDLSSFISTFDVSPSETDPAMILMATRGPSSGAYYLCKPSETTIGRSKSADVSIPGDGRLSPIHARVSFDVGQERWILQDLSSRFGTFLKLNTSEEMLLTVGDVFRLGSSSLRMLGNTE